MAAQILLVEDDHTGRELAEFNLTGSGFGVVAVPSVEAALDAWEPGAFDLVITDLRLPGRDGLSFLDELVEREPQLPVIVVTAYGNVDLAVDAMRRGAADFIGKPFNRGHLLLAVQRTLANRDLKEEVAQLRSRVASAEPTMVAESRPMRDLVSLCERVAGSDASILITGETGSGKELVARRIHQHGPRARGPFVAINCAAIPSELLESELFGHERGAFTGAIRARKGRFRQADGGTLFLDEIGELPLETQGKLLRVLQERKVDVVGRDEAQSVDVRVLAATNIALEAEAEAGRFRADLFYRLNVVEVRVPALRDRPEDIPALVRGFVEQFGGSRNLVLGDEVLEELTRRTWPGNVRQLQNACERLVLLAQGQRLSVADLPPLGPAAETAGVGAEQLSLDNWPPLPKDGLSLVDLEKRVIERVLAQSRWNVTRAAAYLGVPRHVLTYRISKYGISRDA